MFTLVIKTPVGSTYTIYCLVEDLPKVLTYSVPKDCQTVIYKEGSQYTSEMLGFDYPQIVSKLFCKGTPND